MEELEWEGDFNNKMKQHITIEQLKELNQRELKKLNSFIFNSYLQRIAYPEFHTATYQDYVEATHDINIGYMIEVLCNSDFCFPSIGLTESSKRSELIVVGVTCLSGSEKFRGKTFEGNNLCDALWETVKSVLKDRD